MSHRLIEQLRALARSTTFPAERDNANAKADALEAKLKATGESTDADRKRLRKLDDLEVRESPHSPYTYSWHRPEPPERKPRRPWQGSMGDHDAFYREELARALERNKDLKVSDRVREIISRREANAEMIRRFGVD